MTMLEDLQAMKFRFNDTESIRLQKLEKLRLAAIENLGAINEAIWGLISGTLANQTDLQAAFDLKLDAAANAVSASVLATARNIAMSGDVTWTVSFNGSANVSAAGTLATVNSNTGTYGGATTSPQISVDGKGRITGVSAVTITPAFSSLTSVPTTLAGHNITLTSGNVTTALGFTPLSAASNLSDLTNAATARGNLGLGTAALKNTGTSGDAVALLNAANTWSLAQTVAGGIRSNATVNLADDTATSIAVPSGIAHLVAVCCSATPGVSSGSPNGLFWVRPGAPSAQVVALVSATGITFTTGALAGTTGADGTFSISVHTDGRVYLENRIGSTRGVSLTFLASA